MRPIIHVLGMGPGKGYMSLDTLLLLKRSGNVFLRTNIHPGTEDLKAMGIDYKSFDKYYEKCASFEEVYAKIIDSLYHLVYKYGEICYVVPGSPMVYEKTVTKLMETSQEKEVDLDIRPSMSFIDAMASDVGFNLSDIMLADALNLDCHRVNTSMGVIVSQVYDRFVASDVKIKLSGIYGDNKLVTIVSGAGNDDIIKKADIPLYQLDRIEWIDHLTSVYIAPVGFESKSRYDFEDFKGIVDSLREKCPWDSKQTHESLKRYLLEETYEVLEAIDLKDDDKLCEELGDLLLQILLHSKLGVEDGTFGIYEVIDGISKKMIRRHPHVFGDVFAATPDDVSKNWADIKKKEKGFSTQTEVMKSIPSILPALMLSYKVQDKAAEVGFDWDDVKGAMNKVDEELEEVKEVYKGSKRDRIVEEIGDLLFAVVNVARFLQIQPEFALKKASDKFISRFKYIEDAAGAKNQKLQNMSLDQMNVLWEEAKMNKNHKKNQK